MSLYHDVFLFQAEGGDDEAVLTNLFGWNFFLSDQIHHDWGYGLLPKVRRRREHESNILPTKVTRAGADWSEQSPGEVENTNKIGCDWGPSLL